MSARSYLYVPADRPDVLARAFTRGADAVIFDLEDAVAPSAKAGAREALSDFLAGASARDAKDAQGTEIWVRVNPGDDGLRDIRELAGPTVTGFVLAKVEGVASVVAAAAECSTAEVRLGLADGTFALQPLLETAGAVLAAPSIAGASERVVILQIGEADLSAEIGVTLSPDERELLHVRSSVILASAAAALDPPVGPVSVDFRDLDRLRASTDALGRLGFRSRACIHPAQVAVVNDVFTPTLEEMQKARRLVNLFEAADAAGEGIVLDDSGRMVDLAIIRQARRTLGLARPTQA